MRLLSISILALILVSFRPPETKNKVSSTLKSVTVYRIGANLEHTANASLQAGNNELIIDGLSSYLDINSLQVNCPAPVTILGVEFSNDYLGEENISPIVKSLKDSLENVNTSLSKINILINTSSELLDILRTNRDVKGTQSGLSVAELGKLMDYYKNQSLQIQNNLITYRKQKSILEDIVRKVSSQMTEEQKKNTKSGGRIILQLSVAISGNYEFKTSYITQNAYWVPYYDIKADNIKSPLKFIYKARISQTTGIDWKKVKLSLSTASPRQFGDAPLLKTWFLGYINPVYRMNKELAKSNTIPSLEEKSSSADQSLSSVVVRGYGSISGNGQPLYVVNGSIMEESEFKKINPSNIKSVNVLKGEGATSLYGSRGSAGVIVATLKEGLDDYISVSESELDITYDISIPYDIPTNGKAQIATLKETNVPATYKYYAVPKIQNDAFLLAEVVDWQGLNLLPGEANIIFEGTYIGKSFIDPFSSNDTLNLTLGIDKRVVIKKEKMVDYSSVKFLGSNKLQTITYEITVKNNKSEPINIILKDQFPISTNKEIDVTLLEGKDGSVNNEIGVITWQLQVPAGKSEKRRISYSVKYPKDKVVNLQ